MKISHIKNLFLTFTFLLLPASPVHAADKYYVPSEQFNAAFQIMDSGFANALGLFHSATGSFAFDEGAKAISRVKIAIDAGSLTSANRGITRDLLTLFDVGAYPEISFVASADTKFENDKAEIKGTLTAHGASKPATFSATLNHIGSSPRGGGAFAHEGQAIGLSLKGSFKRSDFGFGDEPEVPGRFADTITLTLEMQAIKQ